LWVWGQPGIQRKKKKIHVERLATQSSQNFCKERNGRLSLCDFEMYYKATVIKRLWYWHKDKLQNNNQSSIKN
jgi:hypothetical protein